MVQGPLDKDICPRLPTRQLRAVGVQRSAGRRGRRILLASSVTSITFHDHVLLVSLLLPSRLTIGSSGGKGIQRQVRVLRAVLQVTLP